MNKTKMKRYLVSYKAYTKGKIAPGTNGEMYVNAVSAQAAVDWTVADLCRETGDTINYQVQCVQEIAKVYAWIDANVVCLKEGGYK